MHCTRLQPYIHRYSVGLLFRDELRLGFVYLSKLTAASNAPLIASAGCSRGFEPHFVPSPLCSYKHIHLRCPQWHNGRTYTMQCLRGATAVRCSQGPTALKVGRPGTHPGPYMVSCLRLTRTLFSTFLHGRHPAASVAERFTCICLHCREYYRRPQSVVSMVNKSHTEYVSRGISNLAREHVSTRACIAEPASEQVC